MQSAPRRSSSTSARTSVYGFDDAVALVEPALRELLGLTTDDLWLCMENAAGTGGTIGRSIAELAALSDALDRHPRLGVCLDSCHWWASGVDVSDPAALDDALADLDERIGLDRLRVLHVNDSQTPLGSNRDRHELVGQRPDRRRARDLPRPPRLRRSPGASSETWEDKGDSDRRTSTACEHSGDAACVDGSAPPRPELLAVRDGGEDAEASRARAEARGTPGMRHPRSSSRCGYVPTTSTSHIGSGARRALHCTEATATRFSLLEQVEVDLDVVDLLHAADVAVAPASYAYTNGQVIRRQAAG